MAFLPARMNLFELYGSKLSHKTRHPAQHVALQLAIHSPHHPRPKTCSASQTLVRP